MAKSTHGLVPVTDARGVEVRSMGVHPKARLGRVTAQTIRLLVTGNTALQILPRRNGVAQDPKGLIIVVRSPDRARGVQAEAEMASPTECLRVMAGAAVAHSAVGLGTV